MAKEDLLTLEGLIDEIYPDGRFGVMLDNEHRIIAYTAGKMRRFRIRSVVGDRVHVEMTPYDLSKGRITFREKTPGQGPGGHGAVPGARPSAVGVRYEPRLVDTFEQYGGKGPPKENINVNIKRSSRPKFFLLWRRKLPNPPQPRGSSTLSDQELRRIVANMIG